MTHDARFGAGQRHRRATARYKTLQPQRARGTERPALLGQNCHQHMRQWRLCLSLVAQLLYASLRTRKGFSMPADTTKRPEWSSRYLDHFLFLHDLVDVLVERGEEEAREAFARTAPFHPEITIETHIRTAEAKCGLVSRRPAR